MNLYVVALSLHVLTAILGLGQVAGMAFVAVSAPRGVALSEPVLVALRRLSGGASIALALMLATGLLIEVGAGGAFHQTFWYRGSFLLLLVLGALSGSLRRVLRRAAPTDAGGLRARVLSTTWTMCAIVAVISILMVVRPW